MRIDTFDNLNDESLPSYEDRVPLTDDMSTEDKLKWCEGVFDIHFRTAETRLEEYRKFVELFKGVHVYAHESLNKSVVNFIYEMLEAKVATRGRNKVAIAVMPNNDEPDDVNNAKSCKMLLDARSEDLDIDGIHSDADKAMFQFGTCVIWVLWDHTKGDKSRLYELLEKRYEGKIPKSVEKKIKAKNIGDVVVEVDGADVVFFELGKKKFDDVNYCFRVKYENIHELKLKYPELKDKINEDGEDYYQANDRNQILVKELWHKPTEWLVDGAHIKFISGCALYVGANEYDEIPCVIDTDIDVYGELLGRSFITNIEQLQRQYNTIQTSIARDFSYGSAPKWLVPKGSAKFASLANDSSIVEFSGPIPPVLVKNNPVSDQSFTLQDRFENKISKLSTVYDVSRGEPPKGVTANSALRFLDEQEAQRDSRGIAKRRKRIISVYKMMLRRMSKYYTADDNRTVRILGKHNEYMVKSLKQADFSKVYDIKIQNSSALPDTKTGKISTILDLNIATQKDPIFQKEEIIQMLDLGLESAFKERATSGIDMANMIFEMLVNGESVPAPYRYDDLLSYHNIFVKQMQRPWFKMKVPYETRLNVEAYVKTLEGLMWARSLANQTFASKLALLDNYPLFFTLPEQQIVPSMPAQAQPGGLNMQPQQGVDDGTAAAIGADPGIQ